MARVLKTSYNTCIQSQPKHECIRLDTHSCCILHPITCKQKCMIADNMVYKSAADSMVADIKVHNCVHCHWHYVTLCKILLGNEKCNLVVMWRYTITCVSLPVNKTCICKLVIMYIDVI
jgi:hypothetical protein